MFEDFKHKIEKYQPPIEIVGNVTDADTQKDTELQLYINTIENIEASLSPQQLAFVNIFLESLNKVEAYRAVFPSDDMTDKMCITASNAILRNKKVRFYIGKRQALFEKESIITKHYVIQDLINIVEEASGRKTIKIHDVDAYGNSTVQEKTMYSVKDRLQALEMLAKHLDLMQDEHLTEDKEKTGITFNLIGVDPSKI